MNTSWFQRSMWLVVILVGSSVAFAIQASGQPSAQTVQVDNAVGVETGSTSPEHLACTSSNQPANFTYYSLGSAFDELPLTDVGRICQTPQAGEAVRSNFTSYMYGTCDTRQEGGCAVPIEVQTWPACERNLADYEVQAGVPYPHKMTLTRGTPSAVFDGGTRLELYTGRSTIVIFGNDPDQVARAAAAVQAEPASESPAASASPQAQPLVYRSTLPVPASGAMAGGLSCTSGS